MCISDTTLPISVLSHLSPTVIVILCLFDVTQRCTKSQSACGTTKRSATSVCRVCKDDKHVTIVCTLETLMNQTSLHYLSVAIWGIIAVFEDFIWSQKLSAASRPRAMKGGGGRWEAQCHFYVCSSCLWMEWRFSVCMPKYLSKSWIADTICCSISSNTKSERMLLMFPCTLMVEILMTNKKGYFLFILAVALSCFS